MKGRPTFVVFAALSGVSVHAFAPSPRWVRPATEAPFVTGLNRLADFRPYPSFRLAMAGSSLQETNVIDTEQVPCSLAMTDSYGQEMHVIDTDTEPVSYVVGQEKRWDTDAIVKIGFIAAIAVLTLLKMSLIDTDLSRGWTILETLHRIPLDIWQAYSHILDANPIPTKAVTSASVYTIGDVIAQRTEGKSMGELDRLRILRSLLAGLIGHGPMSHYWYKISENLFDNVFHWTAVWSVVPKVVIDQAFWGPLWNNTYILLLGVMKFESFECIWGDIKRTTIPLVVSGLKLWPLAHMVTYGLVPVENRLLWVDLVEIVWVTILATQAAGHGAAVEADSVDDVPLPIE